MRGLRRQDFRKAAPISAGDYTVYSLQGKTGTGRNCFGVTIEEKKAVIGQNVHVGQMASLSLLANSAVYSHAAHRGAPRESSIRTTVSDLVITSLSD